MNKVKDVLWNSSVAGIAIAIGISIAGISIGNAIIQSKLSQRYVTVKGLAEKEVNANLAIWPIVFTDVSNNLTELKSSIDKKRSLISIYLLEAGFDKEEISHSAPKITDVQADRYYNPNQKAKYRYLAETTITVRSPKVPLIKDSLEKSGDLVDKGIVLKSNSWENKTEYLYTALNSVKPEMIETATLEARKAAEQFAKDSGSEVGKIRNANQGYFSIQNVDSNSPDRKKIRVVTTIQYYLED